MLFKALFLIGILIISILNAQQESCIIDGAKGICQPASTCPYSVDDNDINTAKCSKESDVCCREELTQDEANKINDILRSFANKKPKEKLLSDADAKTVEDELSIFSVRLPNIDDIQEEENFDVEGPTGFHFSFNRPKKGLLELDQYATYLVKFHKEVQKNHLGSDFAIRSNSDNIPQIRKNCPKENLVSPTCSTEKEMKYRTIDGSCNNLKETTYGQANTPLQRIEKSAYEDDNHLPRSKSIDGSELESARKISMTVAEMENFNNTNTDEIQTVLVMQMGQFIDHDITHTPAHTIPCCENYSVSDKSSLDDRCFPIDIPADDPFWKGKKRCMEFTRSLNLPNKKCNLQPRQQPNQITHWLDASNVYGSSEEEIEMLRTHKDGQMKITKVRSHPKFPKTTEINLPSCPASLKPPKDRPSDHICESNGCAKKDKQCFLAGDVRVNEQLNLIVMHTIWVREHNRIAKKLQANNPGWDDEKLFQETRRIVIAEYQHIIYNEWLPLVVGQNQITAFGLRPRTTGYSSSYLDSFDPRVTNEFATAAFRFGHTLIPTKFKQKNSAQRNSETVQRLKDIFFEPNKVQNNPEIIDDLVRGLTSQKGQRWDNKFSEDIVNHLFESQEEVRRGGDGIGGLDLVALNIQRGRDHGLPGYNVYREVVGLGKAKNWDGLKNIRRKDIKNLKKVYRHVDDVDLFVGGFLEKPNDDAFIGQTFQVLIVDTFLRLKYGDRFFYDLGSQHNTFTSTTQFSVNQLQEIRKVTMARVLCDNTEDISEMQPQVFKIMGTHKNKMTSCRDTTSIPEMDLKLFTT